MAEGLLIMVRRRAKEYGIEDERLISFLANVLEDFKMMQEENLATKEDVEVLHKEIEIVRKDIEFLREEMNLKFKQVDEKFQQIDKRFDDINKRLDQFISVMKFTFWVGFSFMGIILQLLCFLCLYSGKFFLINSYLN